MNQQTLTGLLLYLYSHGWNISIHSGPRASVMLVSKEHKVFAYGSGAGLFDAFIAAMHAIPAKLWPEWFRPE